MDLNLAANSHTSKDKVFHFILPFKQKQPACLAHTGMNELHRTDLRTAAMHPVPHQYHNNDSSIEGKSACRYTLAGKSQFLDQNASYRDT